MPRKKTAQTEQSEKLSLPPHAHTVAEQKEMFLSVLAGSGVIDAACKQSGLSRTTAYVHFAKDKNFAARWLEAQETANDEIVTIARENAKKGDTTLLIYFMNHAERQQKWRSRVVQTGNLALEAVSELCESGVISDEQFTQIKELMTAKFEKVKLI